MTVTEFNTKYTQLEDLLFGFAMKLTRNRDRAKDLMQETLMRAFKNKDRFRQGTNFKAWITTIMRNSFINNYRKQRTRNRVETPVEDMNVLTESTIAKESATTQMTMEELQKIVRNLSDLYSVPFTMFYEGYSYLEIAAHLDIPIGTIKSRIFFARRELKKAIRKNYSDGVLSIAA